MTVCGSFFGCLRISSLLFAFLQGELKQFIAECEAAGMRISTSMSEAMVPRQDGVPTLGQRRIAVPSGGVQLSQGLQWCTEEKTELSVKAKLWIPAFTYDHKLWVNTKSMRQKIQVEEISLL